jgi:hypothetical protein
MRTWYRVLAGLVSGLLALEGIYFIWLGTVFYRLHLHAGNGAATGAAVPAMVWQDGFIGLFFLVTAAAYALNLRRVRFWVAVSSPLFLLYGIPRSRSTPPFVFSLRSLFELDLSSCGLAAAYVFILIGVLAPLCWWIERRGSGGMRGPASAR